jgi:HD-like signal output (HDOD) protein
VTTSTSPDQSGSAVDLTGAAGLDSILASIESMASQRPVAARIVSATNTDTVGAAELARILAGDVPLAGRVMKLANSAMFGMRGRVETLQFAVTVVGFTTVRTMASVTLTDLEDESRLPEDFWTTTTHLALAAAAAGPALDHRAQDALCIGLLAEMGAALLHHNDGDAYRECVAGARTFAARRAAERRRYGMSSLDLSALALERWSFPQSVVLPMQQVDSEGSLHGAVLRVAYEVAGRVADPDRTPLAIARLSCGRLDEGAIRPVLHKVRQEADELRRALLGD